MEALKLGAEKASDSNSAKEGILHTTHLVAWLWSTFTDCLPWALSMSQPAAETGSGAAYAPCPPAAPGVQWSLLRGGRGSLPGSLGHLGLEVQHEKGRDDQMTATPQGSVCPRRSGENPQTSLRGDGETEACLGEWARAVKTWEVLGSKTRMGEGPVLRGPRGMRRAFDFNLRFFFCFKRHPAGAWFLRKHRAGESLGVSLCTHFQEKCRGSTEGPDSVPLGMASPNRQTSHYRQI